MIEKYQYITTRNADKTSFTAIVTESVEGQNHYYIEPDLSNVIVMINTSADRSTHVRRIFNAEKFAMVKFDANIQYLIDDAVVMSEEFDENETESFYKIPSNIHFVGNDEVTFQMGLDPR